MENEFPRDTLKRFFISVGWCYNRLLKNDFRSLFRHSRPCFILLGQAPRESGLFRLLLDPRSPILAFEDKFHGDDESGCMICLFQQAVKWVTLCGIDGLCPLLKC
jgi:hypothetical protein